MSDAKVLSRRDVSALLQRAEADIVAHHLQIQRQLEAGRVAIAAIAAAADGMFVAAGQLDAVIADLAGQAKQDLLTFGWLAPTSAGQRQAVVLDRHRQEVDHPLRTVAVLSIHLAIVDRQVALVSSTTAFDDGAVRVHQPDLVRRLIGLFEQVWASATPSCEPEGLTPQESRLIKLLAHGHTDESAARRMAVSPRSVQRMMNQLNDKLGASSRFQAGLEAGRQGWI